MRVKTRRLVLLVVALTVAIATMGLSGGAGATAPRAQGIDGTKIKIGGFIDNASFSGADDGFNARISRANKTKELGKYTIDFIGTTDVGGSTDKALSTAQSLVERDGVYAVAPVVSLGLQQATATYLAGKKVPFAGAGFTNAYCTPNTYGLSPLGCAVGGKYSYTTAINGVAKALGKQPSDLKWAFVGLAVPDGQTTVDNFTKLTEAEGGKVVYNKAVIPYGGGGDLQPFVSAVMDTKPDIVWPLAGQEVLGFTSAMKAAGYTGQMVNSAFYSPGLLTKFKVIGDTLDGSLVQATTPVIESDSPFVKQMVKDYAALGKTDADITFGGEYAYMTADLLISMMKKVAPNFDKLVPTIAKGFSYKPPKDGIPFTWPAAYNQSGQCNTIVKISGGQYQIATPYNCDGKKVQVGS
jgi:ABC-type branched-subunit amino acid transport system substrate-binding protein